MEWSHIISIISEKTNCCFNHQRCRIKYLQETVIISSIFQTIWTKLHIEIHFLIESRPHLPYKEKSVDALWGNSVLFHWYFMNSNVCCVHTQHFWIWKQSAIYLQFQFICINTGMFNGRNFNKWHILHISTRGKKTKHNNR